MGNVLINDEYLKAIGDAIRTKSGTTDKIKPADMPTAIANIKIPNVRRKINIVNPSPFKQRIRVEYIEDIVSITESTVIDSSPRIHSYVWPTQGYKEGVLNIEDNHTLTEDEITITATEATQQYQKGDKVSLDEYYKQILGNNLTEFPEVNATYLKSVYPTSMKNFLNLYEIYIQNILANTKNIIIDLRELDTRYCTNMSNAFSNINYMDIEILGIESLDVSNVTNFYCTFYNNYDRRDKRNINLNLSNWDVRNGTEFRLFGYYLNTLDVSSFGENEKLNTSNKTLFVRFIDNLIIDGKYVCLADINQYSTVTNLYAPHNLLDQYKTVNGSNITNYKPCEKLIKATIPSKSAISFNESIMPEQDGIAYIPYKTTKVTYCVVSPNYLPVTGEIDVSGMARSEEKDISLEDITKDASGYVLTVNATPTNAAVKLIYKGAALTGNKIMVPANAEVNVEIICDQYKTIRKTVIVSEKSQIDNNTMKVRIADHANFANSYTFSYVTSTLLDNDNFAIDTDKKCLYSKKAYNVNKGISTGYIHIPANTFDSDRTLKVSVRTNAEANYDTGVILVGNANLSGNYTPYDGNEGNTVTLNSNKYTLLYNSYGKSETAFRTVSTTLKANTEYYIIFAYTKDGSGNSCEDKMFIESIDIE